MSEKVPQHLGIIMDGNRRWAKMHGLPILEGHRRGYDKLKEVGEWCMERGVKVLTVFAFSTENWKRAASEVAYLMDLFYRAFTNEVEEFMRRNIRVRIIGDRAGLPENVGRAATALEERTRENTRGTLQLAINYGGHTEICDAVRALLGQHVAPAEITEEAIASRLYAPDTPPPDLIIRTSGEQRLSGFLTWQSAYSELYFIQKHWPDFTEADLDAACAWYADRDRRFGQ
ncbi:di-trans,poly-cis-decaprenylcistransferase [Candidatus Uhrbacteria bacterium]|nr:di-trans,poly-cis-decaprenylcistransferase [Candidatus Uhrbacteria bacterium]